MILYCKRKAELTSCGLRGYSLVSTIITRQWNKTFLLLFKVFVMVLLFLCYSLAEEEKWSNTVSVN